MVLAFGTTSCGVALHAPAQQISVVPEDPYALVRPNPALPTVSTQPLALGLGQTVVSLTFDDGRASNLAAGSILAEHGLAGTFFVNSGHVGQPGFLSLDDLDSMAIMGNEIGGHTVTHPELDNIHPDEARRQICNDRATLLGWGYPVRSFSYPFTSTSSELEGIVRKCGYNSARSLGELRPVRPRMDVPPEESCTACALTESVPPGNPMLTKAPGQYVSDWTPTDLEQRIEEARTVGGWLQLTFHGLCPGDCSPISNSQEQFGQLVEWLAARQAAGALAVRTVGEVIGGPVQPAVVVPVPSPPPVGVNGVVNSGFEERDGDRPSCWLASSFGRNSPEFSFVPDGRDGSTASRLVMSGYVDGDAKLLQSPDLGACAPAVLPGRIYTVSAWYKSTVPTSFSVQFRGLRGGWSYGLGSPQLPPADEFTLAQWTLPPIPQSVSAISFGLTLAEDGVLLTDDYSLMEEPGGPS